MTIISVSPHPPKKAILRRRSNPCFCVKCTLPNVRLHKRIFSSHIPNVFILVSLQQEFDAFPLSLLDDFFVKIKCSLK